MYDIRVENGKIVTYFFEKEERVEIAEGNDFEEIGRSSVYIDGKPFVEHRLRVDGSEDEVAVMVPENERYVRVEH